jgi:hypothetical protein
MKCRMNLTNVDEIFLSISIKRAVALFSRKYKCLEAFIFLPSLLQENKIEQKYIENEK